jgi:hypothetical protein
MENEVQNKNPKVFEYLKNRCNYIIFKGLYQKGMSLNDLRQKFEFRGINPTIFSQKIFIRIITRDFDDKGIKLGTNSIIGLVNEAVAKKYLFRWGEENMFLVTQEFLDYIKNLSSPFIKFDLETYDAEDIEIQTLECPYCHEQTKFPTDEGFFEVKCGKCEKDFKIITGIIKNFKDTTLEIERFQDDIQPTLSLTLLIKEEHKTFNFHTAHPVLIERNDKVALIYKKGWLFEDYSDMPNKIANLTSSQIYKV